MILKISKRNIALVGFFFCFIPFFSVYPTQNDLQPLYLLPILFLTLLDKKLQSFTKFELFFLIIVLYSLININFSNSNFSLIKLFSLLFSFFTFHFSRVYFKFFNQKHLFFIVIINFLAVLFHWFGPTLFVEIFGSFIRVIKISTADNSRGASGLAAEPGFTGALSVFYIAIALFLKKYKNQKNFFFINIFLSFLILLMTESGTGFLFIFIFMSIYFIELGFKRAFIGFMALAPLLIFMINLDFARGAFILKNFIESPINFFYVDQSISMRMTNFLIGILSVYENIYGHGIGSWDLVASKLIIDYDIFKKLSLIGLGQLSAFAEYSLRIGLIFWIFIGSFVFYSIKNKKKSFMTLAALFILASFSMAFPPTWILLSIVMYSDQIIERDDKILSKK